MDYASSTPTDNKVLQVMRNLERRNFANPSGLYTESMFAKQQLDTARYQIANVINASGKDMYFTGSGTESNNIAILGLWNKVKNTNPNAHFIFSNIEHSSVLEIAKVIEREGGNVTLLKVNEMGLLSPKQVSEAITEKTVLVSVMYANNEIGIIQPIYEIGRIIKEHKRLNNTEFPYFHTDACQAMNYLPLDVFKFGLDMVTMDGLKIYGPKGVGVLYKHSRVNLSPVMYGGGQENNLRSGTENVAGAVGFAKALRICADIREKESNRLESIRDYGIQVLLNNFPKAVLNGDREHRLPNNINICIPGIDAEFVVVSLDVHGISASYSSSCMTLKENSTSYVVDALGNGCGDSSLRFTLGRHTRKSDMDVLVSVLKKIIK